jgi:hypothetical protein
MVSLQRKFLGLCDIRATDEATVKKCRNINPGTAGSKGGFEKYFEKLTLGPSFLEVFGGSPPGIIWTFEYRETHLRMQKKVVLKTGKQSKATKDKAVKFLDHIWLETNDKRIQRTTHASPTTLTR